MLLLSAIAIANVMNVLPAQMASVTSRLIDKLEMKVS